MWFAPVLEPDEVAVDPQAVAAGAFVDVPASAQPQGVPAHRNVATPVAFGAEAVGPRGPVPTLGEHTDAVLAEAGYSPEEVSALRAAGAVG